MKDFGYDIADFTAIDPLFGDLATFDRLVTEAHRRNIKVIVDYVPNHTSDQHSWFQESRQSRDNPKRDWYIWRDADPAGNAPNNWGSVFGGRAWTWDETTQQYYFHQFDPSQPDLNWRNPAVRQAMYEVLRFWLKRGVDGFRMDVIYMVWKHPAMPDQPIVPAWTGRGDNDLFGKQQQIYSQNYDGIHAIMREIRGVLDEFDDTFSVGEIWLDLPERVKYYGTPDAPELHMPFNFGLIANASFLEQTTWTATQIHQLVEACEATIPPHGWNNWVLGNHDISRVASRLGSENLARLAALLLLTLRGTPTIYMGEEIGMVNGSIAPDEVQDPQGRILGAHLSRDLCRTPMQWDDSAYAGFSTVLTWLPVHPDYRQRNVAVQQDDPRSMLTLYRRLLWTRQASAALSVGTYQTRFVQDDVFAYERFSDPERWFIALNFAAEARPLDLPSGMLVLNTLLDQEGAVGGNYTLRPYEGLLLRLS
jgi:glycosidase